MQISFDELKNKYCAPSKYSSASFHGTCYCVGGAFICAFRNLELSNASDAVRFPSAGDLHVHLQDYNRQLNDEIAEIFAGEIIDNNDAQNFELSWAWLKRAMEYKTTTPVDSE